MLRAFWNNNSLWNMMWACA